MNYSLHCEEYRGDFIFVENRAAGSYCRVTSRYVDEVCRNGLRIDLRGFECQRGLVFMITPAEQVKYFISDALHLLADLVISVGQRAMRILRDAMPLPPGSFTPKCRGSVSRFQVLRL